MQTENEHLQTIYTERYTACFELYLSCGGSNLSWVERRMRELGFPDFNRRILYNRKERGTEKPGWIEKFGWKEHLSAASSLKGTNSIARGKAAGRDPGNVPGEDGRLPEGEPRPSEVAPHQGALVPHVYDPGVTQANPGLLNASPSATENPPASFEAWLKQVSPELTWDWPYQKYIYKHLQRVTDGTCKRLMIFMPPRHGKSELVTIRYAGWRLWNDPKMKIIVSSYNQKLADKFSRSIRKLLSGEEDRQVRSAERGVRNEELGTPPAGTFPSPKGIKSIAQGKAKGRDPGSGCHACALPEGEQPLGCVVAPL